MRRADKFQVLMTCGAFEPGFRRGGPIKSAAHIVDTVSNAVDLRVVVSDRDQGDTEPYPGLSGKWVDRGRSRVFYLQHGNLKQWWRLFRDTRRTRYDVLYLNSLWEKIFTLPPVLAARLGLLRTNLILLAPRGELASGALSLKARKKSTYLKLFSLLLRSMPVLWHASTELEAKDIRARIPGAKVIVNSDQAYFPAEPIEPELSTETQPRLVFLSRISPVKNLDILLSALKTTHHSLDLDVYGPIWDKAYWTTCQKVMEEIPTNVRVRYLGEVKPDDVRGVFAQYDAFVLPTKGENFGHVIAESLSAACPVVCPDTTPWSPVLRSGGGVVLTGNLQQAIESFITDMAAMTLDARHDARLAAAEAYRIWYAKSDRLNVIDAVRHAIEGSTADA
jgi:glycosyltransferase involved in cell wall biosynthesis